MKIARVFPRKTSMTPIDELSFVNCTPPMYLTDIDEVHISVAFTYDIPKAEWLFDQWQILGVPVKIGGAAFGKKSGEFVPCMYIKKGCTITSRGCPNHCWFCSVPKREGGLRELAIKDGFNILDDNLLACSDEHIHKVFEMLSRQDQKPIFTGGLEAKILKPWHAELLRSSKPTRMYFAYDTADDLEPLIEAGKLLRSVGFTSTSHVLACYVLIGYPNDTFEKAETRLIETIQAGFMPYSMLYKDQDGNEDKEWRKFQRSWTNHTIVGTKMKQYQDERE